MTHQYAHPEYLISPAELNTKLGDPNLVVLDVTTTLIPDGKGNGGFNLISGLDEFEKGHIPGARYAHLENDLSEPHDGLLFTLPSPENFAAAAAKLGIGADSFVVLYSTAQPGWAARVWLMLRAYGFNNAAILNGGFSAWKADGYAVSTGTSQPIERPVHPYEWQDKRQNYFVGTDEVEAVVSGSTDSKLINALPVDTFNGTGSIYYGRPGHIPGSLNIPTGSLIGSDGKYLDADALAELFALKTVDASDKVITYCGAGVAASNVAFARLLMGNNEAKVYDGSMLEWAQNPAREIVTWRTQRY